MTALAGAGIRIVVFDLGGVVVRICRSIKEAGALAGIDIPDRLLTPEKRSERRALHAEYERGRMTCDQFFRAIALTTGGALTQQQFRAIHEAWLIDEYPGIGALMDRLHAAGIQTGVLSNTNARHWDQMHTAPRFASLHKPRHRHASHLLGLAKPEEAIFRAFESRSGFAPREIIFFDDLKPNIAGARAAGWRAHLIDPDGDPAEQARAAFEGPIAPKEPIAQAIDERC